MKICILRDIFKLDISLGSVSNRESEVFNKCKDAYENLEYVFNGEAKSRRNWRLPLTGDEPPPKVTASIQDVYVKRNK